MHPKNYVGVEFTHQINLGVIGLADKNKKVRYFTVYGSYKTVTYFPFYDQKQVRCIAVPNFYD